MANSVDMKILVQHLVNGTFNENLCLVCLLPLDDRCENIFTKIHKSGKEYCAADVLKEICRIELSDKEYYSICSDCFIIASSAYKFYLMANRSKEIIEYYLKQLKFHINSIYDAGEDAVSNGVCISLPIAEPKTVNFDYDLAGLATFYDSDSESINTNISIGAEEITKPTHKGNNKDKVNLQANIQTVDTKNDKIDLRELVIVMEDNGDASFFRIQNDGTMSQVDDDETKNFKKVFASSTQHDAVLKDVKKRRIRSPMAFKSCSKCPIKYRFIGKMKEHMKQEHNIDLFICKVCDITIEGDEEFTKHLEEHTNLHICTICNTVFKRQDTIVAHLKKHEEESKNHVKGGHVCEICGQLMLTEEELKEHHDNKHRKKFTCFYCGRLYKGELSFELHVKKHELYMKKGDQKGKLKSGTNIQSQNSDKSKTRYPCTRCNRDFVDQRALMWHLRLHDNQRPYECQECGRAFVSMNRRNQHALCAHTAPARRCPLCPALFHLRSMVNTHVKKVHLKSHKRRTRSSKYPEVSWRTEPVPIQELSVAIQNDILELQTSQKSNK